MANEICVKMAEDRMYKDLWPIKELYAGLPSRADNSVFDDGKPRAIASTSAYWQHGKCHAGNGNEFAGQIECLVDEGGRTLYVSWGSTARSRAEVMHQLASIGVTVTGPGRFSREIDTPPWKRKGWDARAELDKAEVNKAAGYERMERLRVALDTAAGEAAYRKRECQATAKENFELRAQVAAHACQIVRQNDRIGTLLFEAAKRTDELRELQAEVAALRAKHLVPAPDPKPLPAVKAISRAWGLR